MHRLLLNRNSERIGNRYKGLRCFLSLPLQAEHPRESSREGLNAIDNPSGQTEEQGLKGQHLHDMAVFDIGLRPSVPVPIYSSGDRRKDQQIRRQVRR